MEKIDRLNVPRSIAQIVAIVKKHDPSLEPWTVRRLLKQLHAEHGGVLVKLANGQLRVSMEGLARAWPGFGREIPQPEDLEEVREGQDDHARQLRELAKEVAKLRRRVVALERGMVGPSRGPED